MRQHTVIGAKIIGNHPSGLLHTAQIVALNHHEKRNGSGYSNGLAGEDIPHVARVVAIADVFDALTSGRPHKRAWSVEGAVGLIRQQCNQHFTPELVGIFLDCLPEILKTRKRWADAKS
ncbi:HD-GYP domain-containing protein [Pseudomonas sp. MWU13-2105]|uniref:HD-GYP domain-containing protein n=1 Tax=Pseudomonas sp. MWU13-2105 TaxID=2935074 RepID=UPI00200DD2C5|nr:HD domain-containing phosphohydrolase [Pseudomonas sp. MWU13-2105]